MPYEIYDETAYPSDWWETYNEEDDSKFHCEQDSTYCCFDPEYDGPPGYCYCKPGWNSLYAKYSWQITQWYYSTKWKIERRIRGILTGGKKNSDDLPF